MRRAIGFVDGKNKGLFAAYNNKPLNGQRAGGDAVGRQFDDLGVGDGSIGNLCRPHRALLNQRRGYSTERDLRRANGGISDLDVGDRRVCYLSRSYGNLYAEVWKKR